MSLNNTTVLEVLPAGVVILNARGLVTECNPAAVSLLGEPLIGERWAAVIGRCFAPQADDGHEVSLRSGRRLNVQTCSLENGPGQLVMLYDVTETRELQSRLARHERLSMMGRMVANLAHQVRTPLSAALLYASHLENPQLTPELLQKCSRKLVSRLQHLERQVQEMLIFARGDCPVAERVAVADLWDDLQAAAEGTMGLRQVAIRWCADADLSGAIVCNRETLVGAVMNLVNNAADALQGGESPRIDVHLSVQPTHVIVEVLDNGCGFDAETGRRLKEAFFTTKSQGTGLGLAVVDGIARAHGGSFLIESAGVGRGARACLCLPLLTQAQPTVPGSSAQVGPAPTLPVSDDFIPQAAREAAWKPVQQSLATGGFAHV